MVILTERPDAMTGFLPALPHQAAWSRADDLDSPTEDIWNALVGPVPAWALELDVPTLAGRTWPRLVLVSEAPTSLFDVLHTRLPDLVLRVGGTACVALTGQRFHGDRGRPWRAAEGNLHLSAATVMKIPASAGGLALTMLPAVAVVDAIRAATRDAVSPGIKWINDVVVDDGEVGGVLAASRVFRGEIDLAVFGVGVNVSAVPAGPPTPFVPASRCVRKCPGGEDVTLGSMLWHVLDALASRVAQLQREGPEPIRRDYKRLSVAIGRRVRVWDAVITDDTDLDAWPPPRAAGVVLDIDADLGLHLDGHPAAITGGRLAFEEACVAMGL
jgi:biotin-[acetyl-CoA-carboxylase] ligase BirA-like protein